MIEHDDEKLREALIRDEGLRLKPYSDTVGKLTIGVGRNLTDLGISTGEAYLLLDNDVKSAIASCNAYPWWSRLNDARQRAIVNMMFNLGPHAFSGFRDMIAALAVDDYNAASDAARSSRWYEQVGGRATRIVRIIREGTE